MTLAAGVARSIAIFIATWIGWRLLKRLFVRHPLSELPGPPAESWLTGSFLSFLHSEKAWAYHDETTKKYGKTFKFAGIMGEDILYTYDAKAMHHVVVKDQNSYEETDEFRSTAYLTLGMSLFASMGDHHRKQRKILNPVFSIAHLREMTPVFYGVGHRLQKSLMTEISGGKKEIDVLDWMGRTALELLGQAGYGYSFDSLEVGQEPHPYATTLKDMLITMNDGLLTMARQLVVPWASHIGTPAFQRKVLDLVPWPKLQSVLNMVDLMESTSIEIVEAAKESLRSGADQSTRIGGGKDIITLLLKANELASEEDRLPDHEVLAQISALTFAGMDTSTNSLSRLLHLLSTHPDVQEKLRKEVTDAFKENDGADLNYEQLVNLPYLDAVVRETLRVYAPVCFAVRQAMRDTVLPLSNPVRTLNGEERTELFIPKDTKIFMSLHKCNTDPDIWGPDAEEWKPERWLNGLPESVAASKVPGVYSHLMTFLGGGRACIGFKFAQLEIKVVLSLLLQTIHFDPTDKKMIWQYNAVVQPTTEDAELMESGVKKLQMPLFLSRA